MYAIYDAEDIIVGVITKEAAKHSTILEVLEDNDFIVKDIQNFKIFGDDEE